jgi:phage virion morphogenesis protein
MITTIEVTSDTIAPVLERLARANADFTPLMREISGALLDAVEENFAREGRPQWAPLSPVTIAQRGNSGPILQRSGQLAASIVPDHDATSATVGTNKVYGPTLQFGAAKGAFGSTKRGAPIPWGTIPPRPFLAVADEDHEAILELTADYERRAALG